MHRFFSFPFPTILPLKENRSILSALYIMKQKMYIQITSLEKLPLAMLFTLCEKFQGTVKYCCWTEDMILYFLLVRTSKEIASFSHLAHIYSLPILPLSHTSFWPPLFTSLLFLWLCLSDARLSIFLSNAHKPPGRHLFPLLTVKDFFQKFAYTLSKLRNIINFTWKPLLMQAYKQNRSWCYIMERRLLKLTISSQQHKQAV